jgi:hypothetical protein
MASLVPASFAASIMALPAEMRTIIWRQAFSDVPGILPSGIPLSEYKWTDIFRFGSATYREAAPFFHENLDMHIEEADLLDRNDSNLRTRVPPFLRFKYVDSIEKALVWGEVLPAFASQYLSGPQIVDGRPFKLTPVGPYLTSLQSVAGDSTINVDDFDGNASLLDPATFSVRANISAQDIQSVVEAALPELWELLFWVSVADRQLQMSLTIRIEYEEEKVSAGPPTWIQGC